MVRFRNCAVVALAFVAMAMPSVAQDLFIPSLTFRTGAYSPGGIPLANGYGDYFDMLNERDGGLNGVPFRVVECETAYNTAQGVECYESLKNQHGGALLIQPVSTGTTYQLIPKAAVDEIPIFSMGYGRTSASNGRVFPWVFNFPATYWDQASVLTKYIGEREGGIANLNGKKIALVYHNSAYGKEPIPTLLALSAKHGFELLTLAVDHPGQEQKSTWLQIRREKPDWVLLWGWGVMNQVALKEAASIRFPMDRFIGNWWAASEVDVGPAGMDADGYLAAGFHRPGADTKVHQDIFKYLYDKGKGRANREVIGEILYNRGVVMAMWTVEAIRTAMELHGTRQPTGAQVRDGFEALDVDNARLREIGMEGFVPEVKITCSNHTGPGVVALQQWDAKAKKWSFVTDFYTADREVIDPLIEADSAAYAAEQGITPRDC